MGDDGIIRELVYVQDFLKKTEVISENTLLAELTVSIRLYENDYIDNSAYMQFQTLFGSKVDEKFAVFNEKEGQIKLS